MASFFCGGDYVGEIRKGRSKRSLRKKTVRGTVFADVCVPSRAEARRANLASGFYTLKQTE